MTVTPYGTSRSKKEEVREMFDNIAPTYDLLNHTLSLNVDKAWRRKAIREAGLSRPRTILDVATGTADLAIQAASLHPEKIVGVDLSAEMLRVGEQKIAKLKLDQLITLQQGDSEDLPFSEAEFDVAMAAFGVRNFENTRKGLQEMHRILKPGGKIVVLEFTNPANPLINYFYQLYFKGILPIIGKLISKDFSAYRYLPESVGAFLQREDFTALLDDCGFRESRYRSLTLGIACLYTAIK